MKVKELISLMLVFVLALTMTFTLSGCKTNNDLTIDSYRFGKNGEDDIIIIKFHFKNNTGYETSMDDEYIISLYQNNVALDEYDYGYFADSEDSQTDEDNLDLEYNEESRYKYIRDGGEYYPEMAFYLEDTNTDVEIIIEPFASLFSKERTEIIKLK